MLLFFPRQLVPAAGALIIIALLSGCSALSLGAPFKVNPHQAIKVGHDAQKDVLRKMGTPYRRLQDPQGPKQAPGARTAKSGRAENPIHKV